jgi:hypothetical protein
MRLRDLRGLRLAMKSKTGDEMKGRELKLWEAVKIVEEGGKVLALNDREIVQVSRDGQLLCNEGDSWSGPYFEYVAAIQERTIADDIEYLRCYIKDLDLKIGVIRNELLNEIAKITPVKHLGPTPFRYDVGPTNQLNMGDLKKMEEQAKEFNRQFPKVTL